MIQASRNIGYRPWSTSWKKVAVSACWISTSTPRFWRHISTMGGGAGAAVPRPVPRVERVSRVLDALQVVQGDAGHVHVARLVQRDAAAGQQVTDRLPVGHAQGVGVVG